MTKTIGLICASLRNNSYNRIIAESLAVMDGSAHFVVTKNRKWLRDSSVLLLNRMYI
ncbi:MULTISPECIES: hypothetical protein [Peribacillus]|uniref:hypothetical protein n=1 Tax=Peribacillus TaxID=2675229 RepID=UPI001E457868|nr:hypothetical protein [Brevibacillus sp. JNUCC-41]